MKITKRTVKPYYRIIDALPEVKRETAHTALWEAIEKLLAAGSGHIA